ncbi:HAMP domain-containing protein [Mycobacterium simiae]
MARRRLRSPFAPAGRPLLISGALIPTLVGAAVIAALALWGLPTGTALAQPRVLRFNIVTALCYCTVSLPSAVISGYLWMSLPAGASDATARRVVLAIPGRMAVLHGTVWSMASVVFVPVFDASELGLLQAGFNTMAAGLRERERLRDLFGRHVGREMARRAEQLAGTGDRIEFGGVNRNVAALFVDLVGSTRLAITVEPHELLATLNEFFTVVVTREPAQTLCDFCSSILFRKASKPMPPWPAMTSS